MDRQQEVHKMLGGRTPAEFVELSGHERDAVYARYLVSENRVRIEEGDDSDFFNPELAQGVLLRQEYFVGNDTAGQQIAREAREAYCTLNDFVVRSSWLNEFLHDRLTNGESFRVDSLLRNITVTVDLEHTNDFSGYHPEDEQFMGNSKGRGSGKRKRRRKEVEPWAVQDLKQLFALENAERIGIDIEGGGACDGQDLGTQIKIKEIAAVIKELIARFPGQKLGIQKIQYQPGREYKICHDFKPYWKPPTTQARENLHQGRASFEELMQIQISEWTRKTSQSITAQAMDWPCQL